MGGRLGRNTQLLVPLFHRKDRTFVTHLVFSLHFYAFMLVSLCALLLVLRATSLFFGGSAGSQRIDWSLFGTLLVACAIYLHAAIGRVYAVRASDVFSLSCYSPQRLPAVCWVIASPSS